ncbi:hypothetical protein [Rivihabitans pingtungensis]|uniref:Uncharacterized protein n=1 Tax=Rivihabitans pingtungensis TaxID=1054498 RepID=A0A318KJV1_9NEIS|nr:hypothetical protein [Rivihabitans pingtungensis]PXX75240.1 hypothetical protein DFR34_12613 [Rivihabitans pingtungensis]
MQVNTSASAMLPTIKKATHAEDDGKLVANSRGEFGMAFTFDPELADTVHNGVRYFMPPSHLVEKGDAETLLKKHLSPEAWAGVKRMLDDVATGRDKLSPEEYDPVNYEKQLQTQVDSIFRGPAGNILAVVYKDGSAETHANIDLSALAASAKGLSEHEYRAAMRNGVAAALGSRAVASYYDYHKPAPTMKDIIREEQAFNSRVASR